MEDRFLKKILDATAKMREQKGERELSEKALKIIQNCTLKNGSDEDNLVVCFKEILGDAWYAKEKKKGAAVDFALVKALDKTILITKVHILEVDGIHGVDNEGVVHSFGSRIVKGVATDEEIHAWYEEFLNG